MSTIRAVLLAWFVLAVGLPLDAQPRLVISGQGPDAVASPSLTASIDLRTGAVERAETTPWNQPLITSDGRYLVAAPPPGGTLPTLSIRDLLTGTTDVLPLDSHVARRVVMHPRRFELFALMTDGLVASITRDGVHPLYTCLQGGGIDVSGDGLRLALTCERDIVVLDASSGAQIARFDGQAFGLSSPVANFDGSRVLVRRWIVEWSLSVWDVATETMISEGMASSILTLLPVVVPTPARDAVLVGTEYGGIPGLYGSRVLLVDYTTLTVRQTLPLAGREFCKLHTLATGCLRLSTAAFTADGRYVVAGSTESSNPSLALRAKVQIADLWSNTLVASAAVGEYAGGGIALTLADVPLPPEGVRPDIAGRDVSVSWSLPATSPAVTTYLLEVGFAPGLTNVVLPVSGAETTVSFANVPPGRYFVRVRGTNVTGRGAASSEIVVDVLPQTTTE